MRRGIACAVAALAALAPNAYAAPLPPAPTTVWVAERVARDAPKVTLHAYFNWDRRGGRVSYVGVKMVHGRPRPTGGMTWDTPLTDGPAAHHDGTSYGCAAGSGCDVASGPGITFFGLTYPPISEQPDRIYVAISGLSVEVSLQDSRGWRLTRTTLRARYATSDGQARATGAQFFGEHVEWFTHASLPGGRRGSIAIATPPCRPAHRIGYVREGYGTATLSGGVQRVSFDCQKDISDLVASEDRATTWSFDGPVVGTATGTTRVTVIDL